MEMAIVKKTNNLQEATNHLSSLPIEKDGTISLFSMFAMLLWESDKRKPPTKFLLTDLFKWDGKRQNLKANIFVDIDGEINPKKVTIRNGLTIKVLGEEIVIKMQGGD